MRKYLLAISLPFAGCLAAPVLLASVDPELVEVTARRELFTDSAPFANSSSSLLPESSITPPRALAEFLQQQPGIDYSGQGGLFQTISVRGMSRQRLGAYLLDIPLFTERRAGTAASFIDPMLIQSVELVRGPASVLHGSGAIGGLLRVHPARFNGLNAALGWGSAGDENLQFMGYGNDALDLAIAHRGANNSKTANGEPLNTQFDQYNLSLATYNELSGLQLSSYNLLSYGDDIGKSNSFYPDERVSDYPRERHWASQFAVEDTGIWRGSVYIHAQDLETRVERIDQRLNEVDNQSVDFGGRFVLLKGTQLTPLRIGVDYLARRNVDADETERSLESAQTRQWRILRAERDEVALFSDLQHSIHSLQLAAGIRAAYTNRQADGHSDESEAYGTGFAGVEWFGTDELSLSLQLSAGQRPANLSELFFSGTTGRGSVLGNPNLDTETAINTDLAVRWESASSSISLQAFYTSLDNLIERVAVAPDLLSYRNSRSGEIYGVEISAWRQLGENWVVSAGGHYLESEDDDNNTLQDTAPDRLDLGLGFRESNWTVDLLYEHRFSTNDVALTELPVDSARLLSARVNLALGDQLSLELWGRNLLDDRYTISTDDLSTDGEERALGIQLRWQSK